MVQTKISLAALVGALVAVSCIGGVGDEETERGSEGIVADCDPSWGQCSGDCACAASTPAGQYCYDGWQWCPGTGWEPSCTCASSTPVGQVCTEDGVACDGTYEYRISAESCSNGVHPLLPVRYCSRWTRDSYGSWRCGQTRTCTVDMCTGAFECSTEWTSR